MKFPAIKVKSDKPQRSERKKFPWKTTIAVISVLTGVLGVLFGLPGDGNQAIEFLSSISNTKTEVVNYSPPQIDETSARDADSCISSLVSSRPDAFRCFAGNEVLDPCFVADNSQYTSDTYLDCPYNLTPSSKDVLLHVPQFAGVIRAEQPSDSPLPNSEFGEPWLITMSDGVNCRLVSGQLNMAYGDKASIYACEGTKYASVTNGDINNGRYFFDCKVSGSTEFKPCFAKLVSF